MLLETNAVLGQINISNMSDLAANDKNHGICVMLGYTQQSINSTQTRLHTTLTPHQTHKTQKYILKNLLIQVMSH